MVILYSLLVLSIIPGVVTRVSFSGISIYLFDVFVVLILLTSYRKIFNFIKQNNKALLPVLFMILVSAMGLFFNTKDLFEFLSSTLYLFRVIGYSLVAIPLLALKKESLVKLKHVMLFGGFVFVGLGYIQYWYYPNLRNLFYLGWDEHLYRLFSTFLDPNFAGAFIVLMLLFYADFFFSCFKTSKPYIKALLLAGYLFILPSLFLTYSRSAFIMFFVSAIFYLIFIGKKKLLLFFLGIFLLGIILIPKNLGGEGVKLFRTASIFARINTYEEAITIFTRNPVVGVGFNSLRFVSERYGFVPQDQALASHAAAGIPNSFLFVLTTTGILGFSLFVYLLARIIQEVWNVRRRHILFSNYILAGILGVLVDSLFENSLFYAQIMLWLVLSTGILFGMLNSKNTKKA
ncbi:MAG: O-antigen ligase family protein [Candidatus Levyibacteriota bacterium]